MNPSFDMPDNVEDVSYFVDLFITPNLCSNVAKWTNERHSIFMNDISDEEELPELAKEWQDVTENEIRKYFGLSFLMGLNKKPEVRHYWSKEEKYYSPYFHRQECLPRDR